MSKTTAPARPQALAAPPDDDDEIAGFPDDEQEEDEEQEEDGQDAKTEKKRVSVIRRGITEVLELPLTTSDASVIECVREMKRAQKAQAIELKAAQECGTKLKAVKKQLLMIAVGDQLGE